MEKISLEQFIAEIESTFSNYADSNDIDSQSIKIWTIQALRKFGKNICDRAETLVEVKNGRALLPETFKSLTFALKVDFTPKEEEERKQLVNETIRIENPAIWSSTIQDYIVDYCETKIVTEKTFANKEHHVLYDMQILELEDYVSKEVLDVDCLNLHPSIRNKNNHRVSIVNRTLNCNFKNGFVYLKYNSLPEIDNEIAIPIFTTADIYDYLMVHVERKLVKNLILSNKAGSEIKTLYSDLRQEEAQKFVLAQGEAKWHGLKDGFSRKIYQRNLYNRRRQGL